MSVSSRSSLNRQALDPVHSVVVSACAGSGKTWLLVARIVRLLLAGVAPGEILAITFTRKAAQEMAARLRAWLEALAGSNDEDVRVLLRQLEVPDAESEHALTVARELHERFLTAQPGITISTFHSWFLQLLRAAPLDAGVLGSVALTDRTSPLIAEAWQRLAAACQRTPDGPAARGLELLFRDYGLHSTRALLAAFVQHRAQWWAFAGRADDAVERALAAQAAALPVDPDADVTQELLADEAFLADVQRFARLLCDNGVADRRHSESILAAIGDAAAAFAAVRSAIFTAAGTPRSRRVTNGLGKRHGALAGDELMRLQEGIVERMQSALAALTDQASYRTNAAGLAAGVALLDHYQAVKSDRQVVDFADIEWMAYALLLRSEHAVAMQFKLDSRYRHVLLDEFQDTNALQWLALKAWFEAAAQADTAPVVFLVGDPKQAIYRFRRAEPRLFDVAREWLEANHGAVDLSQDESRRSAQPLLEVVNRLFAGEALFAPFFRTHRAHYSDLPGRVEILPLARNPARPIAGEPSVALRDPLTAPRELDEDLRRRREAEQLVERLREIVDRWVVVDDARTGTPRRAGYGDVMLLVRRRTHLEIYEHALRHAGIPFITSRQGGLLDTLEAADVTALLEFLVSPFDDLKLAHALRSPIFGCTDEELARVSQCAGDSWWERLAALAGSDASGTVVRAHRLLSAWLDRADTLPVHDQLDRIYFEGDVMRRYASAVPAAMRTAVLANLDAFIHRALDVDSGRYPSLPRFIGELADMRDASGEEAPDEGSVAELGDAVRILTVHGAKGLEAPIVWLLDTGAAPPIDRGYGVLVDWPPAAQTPQSFSLSTRMREQSTAQKQHAAAEAEHAAREDLNLLYVAMTRARQALFVSGCEASSVVRSWYARLRAATLQASGSEEAGDDDSTVVSYGDDLALDVGSASVIATTQTEYGFGDAQLDQLDQLDHPVPIGRRLASLDSPGLEYGTAFHAIMEAITADRGVEAESVRARLGLSPVAFGPLWTRATQLVRRPELAHFFDAGGYVCALNEAPLVTAAGELRRLDRVVEFDTDVWVLDYKTGTRASVESTPLEAEYHAQVAEYCAALRQVYPGKTVHGALIFADGTCIEVER